MHEWDARPGGRIRFVMIAPDGTRYDNLVHYEDVAPPTRLAFAHGSPGQPDQFRVVVAFEDEGGRTRLVMRSTHPTPEAMDAVKAFGAVELRLQTLARLDAHVGRAA